ncbi:MAG: glucose-1-phosphate thymidylyltransferase [Sulfobacillus thermotolerans]|uniref:Glucose-1-phosphate thymidylyltransferase n=1 Tax=Sulfobacillus thermotolerans TaxID=338644 RepID=A0ABM6RPX6_9FIRM|nr:glucose-1-phosphate thymidylyltransferase [Sulfobacillus thermotolerans]MCY0907505.1 glucose-1-phosphate thymidylyltransferase [Sulfobacillus thermotolerans]
MKLKGLLLAGGTGSRLRPLTYTGAKQLIPVANRPILFYAVDAMVQAGIEDIGVITGETGEEIRAKLGTGEAFGCHFTYIPQAAPLGLAHAVKTARSYLGQDPFLMFLGDNLLRSGLKDLVDRFKTGQYAASILLTEVEDPRQFGVAVVDQGRVVQLVEKPAEPPSHWALVGAYCFSPDIHEIVEMLKPSKRGEYEITDAIQTLIDQHKVVDATFVQGWWKDTGRPQDVIEANRLMLEDIPTHILGHIDASSEIVGRVQLGRESQIQHSTIRGPVVIGDNVIIRDSYIGPYTAIGDGVTIEETELENTVILPESHISHVPERIDQSLIGRAAVVQGRSQRPRAVRLVLGDQSRVDL